MVANLFFSQLVLIALGWLFLMLHWLWRSAPASTRLTTAPPLPLPRERSKAPKPFPGLTRQPHCDACAQDVTRHREPPGAPPPRLVSLRGRRRQVDTAHHFCPDPACRRCGGYFLETHGTPFHGKRVFPDTLVWAIAALAEGLGLRAVARVFEVDPNTVLVWLVEAADHLEAFSRHFLSNVHVSQVQLDELFALLRAVKAGVISETQVLQRLSRSPRWVWVALAPESTLMLTIAVGERTLVIAQHVVHQVVQVLAPDCAPLFLTDGFTEYMTALLTHYGHVRHASRLKGAIIM
jgi:transposase-like protein